MIQESLVKIRNLGVAFGKTTALKAIDLDIYPGEVIAVIGLNGAGKTTLLKAILGIYKPTCGSIEVNAGRIGYVPQSLSFDRSIPLTVKELLKAYSKKSTQIEGKLGQTGGLHLINKRVGDLSGGELQRVMLANALLTEPDLLLLDEPTAGIDVLGEKSFFEIIRGLQNGHGLAIILVSHDIHLVYRYASRIVCINTTMLCQGPPHEIAENDDIIRIFGGYLTPYEHEHN